MDKENDLQGPLPRSLESGQALKTRGPLGVSFREKVELPEELRDWMLSRFLARFVNECNEVVHQARGNLG